MIAELSDGGRAGSVPAGARQTHDDGAPVLRQVGLPIGVLAEAQGEAQQIQVAAREPILPGEQYLIADDVNREVVTVIRAATSGNEFFLLVTPRLQAAYAAGATFSRLVAPLIALTDGREVAFDRPFQPFGGEAGVGRTFQLGWLPDELPETFEIEVAAEVARPTAALRWEYLAGDRWRPVEPLRDGTQNLTGSGAIEFGGLPGIAPGAVNGQQGYWLRVRLIGGDYGRPLAFEPVDFRDASRGFRLREDTGNLSPPVVERLSISYRARAGADRRHRERVVLSGGGRRRRHRAVRPRLRPAGPVRRRRAGALPGLRPPVPGAARHAPYRARAAPGRGAGGAREPARNRERRGPSSR